MRPRVLTSLRLALRVKDPTVGQGLVEYALIVALISIVVIAGLVLFANALNTNWYNSITSGLNFGS